MNFAIIMKAAHVVCRCAGLASLIAVFVLSFPARSGAQAPQPPCEAEAFPRYPDPGTPPIVEVWRVRDLPAGWVIPACLSWDTALPNAIVVLAGTFRYTGTVDGLAARFGAVSETRGIRYWSVTDRAWRILVTEAFALTEVDGAGRPDFSSTEVMSGRDIYFAQADNRSSGLVKYRMRNQRATPDQLVIAVENVSAVRWLGFSMFSPGSLKSAYFLTHQTNDIWTYYSIGMIGEGSMSWLSDGAPSYINRTVAFFRHYVGIPTDEDPPAALR